MPVLTVSEVLQRQVGEQIPECRGTLKAIYKRSTGINARGPWSLQNAVLTDGKSDLKIKLSDKDEISEAWKGREVWLLATHGKQGFTGLRFEEDSYTDKKTGKPVKSLILKVTPTGSITLNVAVAPKPAQTPPPNVPCDAEGRPIDPDEGEPERPPEPKRNKVPLTPEERHAALVRAVHEASADMTRILNLYLLASEAVLTYAAPAYLERHGVTMSPEQKEKLIMSVYIDTRPRLAGTMPTGAIEPFLKPKGGAQ